MLHDNSLGDRLNAVKNGKSIPRPPKQFKGPIESSKPIENKERSIKRELIDKSILILETFIVSLLYGVAIKTIFSTDWSIFSAFTVGYLFNHVISVFPKVLFPKFFK